MRVAIYGTGGAGGYFGANLARTGEDVTFVARGQHLKAIQAHGLCVETSAGEIVIHPAKATDDPMQVAPVDVIFLGVKAWQVEEAARNMQPMVGPQTLVILPGATTQLIVPQRPPSTQHWSGQFH
jgi:2-dehydropantoate 2-reductase